MADYNPLAIASQAPDPTKQKRVIQGNEALQKLSADLTIGLQTQAANAHRDNAAMDRTLAPLGLARGDSTGLAGLFESLQKGRAAQQNQQNATAVNQRVQGGAQPQFTKGMTGAQFQDANTPVNQITLPAVQAGAASNPAAFEQDKSQSTKFKFMRVPDPSAPNGFRKVPLPQLVEEEHRQGSKAKSKAPTVPEAKADVTSAELDVTTASVEELATVGLKRGTVGGKTVVYRPGPNGKSEIIAEF